MKLRFHCPRIAFPHRTIHPSSSLLRKLLLRTAASTRHCPSIQPFPLPLSFALSRHGTRARFSMVHLAILYGPRDTNLPFNPLGRSSNDDSSLLISPPAWRQASIETTRQFLELLLSSMIDRSLGRKNVISRPIQPPPTPLTPGEEDPRRPGRKESLENIVLPAGRPSVGCRSPVITVIGF